MKSIRYILFFIISLSILSCSGGGDEVANPSDEIDPVISCPQNITVNIPATENSVKIDYETPVGTDNISATTTQTGGLESGALFPVGVTTNTFEVKDLARNTASCSFTVTVTRDEPLAITPYFVGNNPTPAGKKWSKITALTDEFDGTSFDDSKWHRDPSSDPFGWYGRPPALFEADNVSVADGNLNITVEKFASPKNVNNTDWTHGGAILRSKELAKPGYYYECRMKANSTVMSSTFWIAFPQNCNSGPVRKLELDIQECVGRTHAGTATWANGWDAVYHSNTWRHARPCDVSQSAQSPGKKNLTEKNNSRFFVYGCWWKSPTEMLFYLDGEYVYSITPPTDFDIEGHITMAIETYDWNPIEPNNDLVATGTIEERTTKYDWVRTWELNDE